MPVLLSREAKVGLLPETQMHIILTCLLGAASDKVKALEKAGAIVTDSPAKIGAEMLKVSLC